MDNRIAINAIAAQIKDFRRKSGAAIAVAITHEGQAEKERERAAILEQCAKDLEAVLVQLDSNSSDNHSEKDEEKEKKVRLRYQEKGLTTDMIHAIFSNDVIEKSALLDTLRKKEDTRGTSGKLLKRAIDNGDVREDDAGRLYLTAQGETIWKQSPLFRE